MSDVDVYRIETFNRVCWICGVTGTYYDDSNNSNKSRYVRFLVKSDIFEVHQIFIFIIMNSGNDTEYIWILKFCAAIDRQAYMPRYFKE